MDKSNNTKWTYIRTSRLAKLEFMESELKKLKRSLRNALNSNTNNNNGADDENNN